VSNVTRVKVNLRPPRGRSQDDKDKAFKTMHSIFKKRVTEAGILSEWKRRQFYESKSDKKRRKRKEAEINRHKDMLKRNFK